MFTCALLVPPTCSCWKVMDFDSYWFGFISKICDCYTSALKKNKRASMNLKGFFFNVQTSLLSFGAT